MAKRRLARVSKMRILAEMVAQEGEVTLAEAAKALYRGRSGEARKKVSRLLAAYRTNGRTDLRVRDGKICRAS